MLSKYEIDQLIEEFSPMGFEQQDIIMAWIQSNKRKAATLDILLAKAEQNKRELSVSRLALNRMNSTSIFEKEIQKAIKLSTEETTINYNPDQIKRENSHPVGLRNVGNTCYFNSLLQTIFQVKDLVKTVLLYKEPEDIEKLFTELEISDPVIQKRKKGCVKLVLELQKAFSLMLFGNKSIVNPEKVIGSMIDSQGNIVKVGEQLDITEFSINFFERIEEGLLIDKKNSEDSQFNGLFFGKSKDFITFEWSNVKSKKEQDSVFGPISINIEEKDLISGLDAYTNFVVDGYRSPDGGITTAKKKIWISTPPKVMTFVLQRVVYDKEKGLQKLSKPFQYPKEIFLDRFLYDNKSALKDMHGEKKSYKAREKKIDSILAQLKDYKDSKMGLLDILNYTDEFLSDQLEEQEKDFVEVNSDSSDEKITDVLDKKELKQVSQAMKKFKSKIQAKILELENKKSHIKKKIETTYSKYKSLKYNLHSVVVHEGGASKKLIFMLIQDGGHYYSYIYDHKEKLWRKYNDSTVTVVSEDEVDKVSVGGQNSACAYCLFYVQEGCEMLEFNPKQIESLKDNLSPSIIEYYENKNDLFKTELSHFNSNIVDTIKDDYKYRMNFVTSEISRLQSELKTKQFPSAPMVSNFANYLLLDNKLNSDIARWITLKTILNEKNIPYNILDGDENNFYYKALNEAITSLTVFNLRSLTLNDKQKSLLYSKKKDYGNLLKSSLIINELFKLISEKKWREAICTINLLHENVGKISNDIFGFISFSMFLLVIMSLKFCSLIDLSLSQAQTKNAFDYLELLVYSLNTRKNADIPKIFRLQVLANLNNTVSTMGAQMLKEPELILFKQHIKRIEDKIEIWPSFDTKNMISQSLIIAIERLDEDESILYQDTKISVKMGEAYSKIFKDKMKLWIEFEQEIRKKEGLLDQNSRGERELITWVEDS